MSLIKEQFTRFRKEKSLSEIRNTHTNKDQKEKETSLCASIILGKTKASYTLEAAVVFPIFISLMVTMMLLMRVLSLEYGMHQAMQESAREAAACKKYANYASVCILTREKIDKKKVPVEFIRGGATGISFLGSSVTDTDIKLKCTYTIPFPTSFFNKKGLLMQQNVSQRRWVGWNPTMAGEEEKYVYVTPNGTAYHASRNCAYLKPSVRSVPASRLAEERNESGHRYGNCPYCKSKNSKVAVYYVTRYGENYHSKMNCSGLKRSIRSETKEEAIAEGYHACPKCAGE